MNSASVCCNIHEFEDAEILEPLEAEENLSQNSRTSYPKQMREEFLGELEEDSFRRGMLESHHYMNTRHQWKHPERESFRPHPLIADSLEQVNNRGNNQVLEELGVKKITSFTKRFPSIPHVNSLP